MKKKRTSKYPDIYISLITYIYLSFQLPFFTWKIPTSRRKKKKKEKKNPPFVSINSRYIYRSKALLSRDKRADFEKDSKRIVGGIRKLNEAGDRGDQSGDKKRAVVARKRCRLCDSVVDIRERWRGGEILRAREQPWRNLNESKVPTSLLLKLVSQRERNRVFSPMLLDRVSDGFIVDTQRHVYTRWIP